MLAPMELLPNEKPDVYQKVPVLVRRHCGHVFTVCLECMDEWADQYNSRGGRAQGQEHHAVLDYFLRCEGFDTVSSVSRQHFIDTGKYLRLEEAAS
jgi:hypothetical protein